MVNNNFAAGDRVRAPRLRDRTASIVMLPGPVSTLSVQPAFIDVPGLALPVRPNARYVLDGWFGMGGGSVGDLAFRLSGPADAFVTWSWLGPVLGTEDETVGEATMVRAFYDPSPAIADPFSTIGCGNSNLGVHIGGRLFCRGFGGTLQLQIAKNADSVGAGAHVMRGSWLRIIRVDPEVFEQVEDSNS